MILVITISNDEFVSQPLRYNPGLRYIDIALLGVWSISVNNFPPTSALLLFGKWSSYQELHRKHMQTKPLTPVVKRGSQLKKSPWRMRSAVRWYRISVQWFLSWPLSLLIAFVSLARAGDIQSYVPEITVNILARSNIPSLRLLQNGKSVSKWKPKVSDDSRTVYVYAVGCLNALHMLFVCVWIGKYD